MPTDITLFAILVWFCVGFFTGAGWALGGWCIAKLTSIRIGSA